MSVAVFEPYSLIFDRDGQPLENGYLYFGTAAQNPQTNPIVVYWDQAGTQIAAQPIRTSGGYPVRNGAPARVYVNADDYSLVIRDKNQRLISSQLNAAVFGSAFVGFLQAGTGAVTRTAQAKMRETVSVLDFGAVGDGVTDDTAAIQAAINYVTSLSGNNKGGKVLLPAGYYKTTAPILMKHGVYLEGEISISPGGTYDGASVLLGMHTGAAVLSLKGAHGCRVSEVSIVTTAGAIPKTGLLLGRSSTASAGLHLLTNVNVAGYFTKAAIYSIASESNLWLHCTYTLIGGGASYGFFTSQGDELSVDSLTGSSNLSNTVVAMEGINMVNDANSVGVVVRGGLAVGTWNFVGCYIIQARGAYIEINNGGADGLDTLGPITFTGTSGEIYDLGTGNSPLQAFNLTGTTGLRGLTINGGRFQFNAATGTERSIKQSSGVTLKQPSINLQTMDNATVELQPSKIQDGFVSAGVQSFIAPTLLNSWSTAYAVANGVDLPGYWKDPTGLVHLKGCINGGTIGLAAFTLPAGYRPSALKIFGVLSNGAIARLDIDTAGNVTPASGSATYVSLDGVCFKPA